MHEGRDSVGQVVGYLQAAHEAGADKVLVDLHQTARSTAELLDLAHRFREELRRS
ncbi:hypothetical protein [Streptomyces globisporus]|uniref:hypothetical protein n=1 Tax=Streptomyces globisporus TaxID=1908 RepID=UPI003804AA2E